MESPESTKCPVCDRLFVTKEIERHVNQCLFLNSKSAEIAPRKRKENVVSPRPTKTAKLSPVSSKISVSPASSSESSSSMSSTQTSGNISHPTDECRARTVQEKQYNFEVPLAEVLRPSIFDDFVGQEQTIGGESLIRKLLDEANVPNLIFWGPPGCGKTTLANIIKEILVQRGKEHGTPIRFVKLYATMAGVNDVKQIINVAKNERQMFQKKTILFMDEIHRFNKSQQDTFLPHIESGMITLIGATTENPSFSLNNALLSRCRVITMDKLSIENVTTILRRAVSFLDGHIVCSENEEIDSRWCIDTKTIEWLAGMSDGDARIALNSLQMAVQSKPTSQTCIALNDVKDSITKSHILYDKKGDEHYNIISAVHKSIRASDDNAALYWVTRMLKGGEDPIYIARRLVRAASEDIGLADPNALVLAVSTMHGCQQIGMPECDVLLAQLTVYLARCPKSREVDRALSRAKSFIMNHKGPLPSVPLHLRNAPTKLMKNLGYGENYNSAHYSVSGLEYMPEGYEHVNFFNESTNKSDDE